MKTKDYQIPARRLQNSARGIIAKPHAAADAELSRLLRRAVGSVPVPAGLESKIFDSLKKRV